MITTKLAKFLGVHMISTKLAKFGASVFLFNSLMEPQLQASLGRFRLNWRLFSRELING